MRNWLIDEQGQREALNDDHEIAPNDSPYRLYRFLTDLESILLATENNRQRLQLMCPLVRRLLAGSSWLQFNFLLPDPDVGWAVLSLYDEPDFPLTIQLVSWLPGFVSPIHNHGTWGLVALISGQEENTFWRSLDPIHHPERIEPIETYTASAGEILCFLPDAIHQVEPIGNEPVVSFNLYGETDFEKRFEFDPIAQTTHVF